MDFQLVEDALKGADWGLDALKNSPLPAGSASWSRNFEGNITHLTFVCPCGCQDVVIIPVNQAQGGSWDWDGNLEKPTLKPSILRMIGCKWHGYLIGGKFSEC